MRRLLAALIIASSTVATADVPRPTPIDIKAAASKLRVFRDSVGKYYVVPAPGEWSDIDEAGKWLFYGDGKSMWQQRIISSSSSTGSNGVDLEWGVWSPRVRGSALASLFSTADRLELACSSSSDDRRPLTPLRADESKVFFAHAAFASPFWQRQSRFLARDDDGLYYFIDMLRPESGSDGYRVFVGQAGAMKELVLANVAEDSAGAIFASKSGSIKISSDGSALWLKDGKRLALTVLDPVDNRYLIYRELGIYKQLGVVCGDV